VFKKGSPILIANKIFHVAVLFLLVAFAINLWQWKFVTASDVTAVFVNNQHGIQRRGQGVDKRFAFEGVHSKVVDNLTDEFPEKSWTKRGVNKTVEKVSGHRHSWQAAADLAMPAVKKTLMI